MSSTVNQQIPPEEERFAKNAYVMVELVYESVLQLYNKGYKTVSPDLVSIAKTLITSFNKTYLIQGFIDTSGVKIEGAEKKKYLTCWDSIKARDEDFFATNAGEVFRYLPMDKVNLFKDLYLTKDAAGNYVVAVELKEQLWKLFDAMIKIAIKYIHRDRKPYSYVEDGETVQDYHNSFFDEVDLERHAEVWGVKLEFPS